jgi:hypothetical protein
MSGRVIIIGAFLMALAGTLIGIALFGNRGAAPEGQVQIVTVPVIITATPDPNATIPVIIITATLDRTQVAVPTGIAASVDGLTVIAPTIDATQLAANPGLQETQISLPQNCILHTVAAGDSPFGIAAQYGANGFDVLAANGLTEQTSTLLQIGDVLIVPLEGCPLDQLPSYQPQSIVVRQPTAAGGATATAGATLTPAAGTTQDAAQNATAEGTAGPAPTITLAPTAANAQVIIERVVRPGDVTAEGVVIRNPGSTVIMTGWSLRDAEGNAYTFGEYILFSNSSVTVYTRAGQNTPAALYWGRDTAVWGEQGDVVTLADAQSRVQATARLSSLIDLGN